MNKFNHYQGVKAYFIHVAIRTVMKVKVSVKILFKKKLINKKSSAINVDKDEIPESGFEFLTINVLLRYIID